MSGLVKCWQGNYPQDGSLKTPQGDPLGWQPQEGISYLVMAQSTCSTNGTECHTVGVQFSLVDSNGGPVPGNGGHILQLSEAKTSSGGPATAPMVYLYWTCPQGWEGNVTIAASPVGDQPVLGTSDMYSIVVMEIEQPMPPA